MSGTSESHVHGVASLLRNRTRFGELLLLAVCLALGVNLLTSGVSVLFEWTPVTQTLAGLFFIIGPVVYFVLRLFGSTPQGREVEAYIPYSPDDNRILSVPGYEFAEHLHEYLALAFSENAAIQSGWEKEPLRDRFCFLPGTDTIELRARMSVDLIQQATEYYILSALSTHLTDYFNREQFDESELTTFGREDVPSVLFRNRFLELFSRPMQDRPAFVTTDSSEEDFAGQVVTAYSCGARYEHFDLVLPNGSRLERVSESVLKLHTPRMTLRTEVCFLGATIPVPLGFHSGYLKGSGKVDSLGVNISIGISFKPLALFTSSGWRYFEWVDSFLQDIEERASAARFFERINWPTLEALLRVLPQPSKDNSSSTGLIQPG